MRRRGRSRTDLDGARVAVPRAPRARKGVLPELRQQVILRDGGCKLRPKPGSHGAVATWPQECWGRLDPHHVLPKGRGGADLPGNLVCLCRRHHRWVHDNPWYSKPMGLLL